MSKLEVGMKTVTTSKGEFIFVKVPEDAIHYSLNMFYKMPVLQFAFENPPRGSHVSLSKRKYDCFPGN